MYKIVDIHPVMKWIAGKLEKETQVENFETGQELLVVKVNDVMERIKQDARWGSLHTVMMEHPHQELEFLEFDVVDKDPQFQCMPGSVQPDDTNVCGG